MPYICLDTFEQKQHVIFWYLLTILTIFPGSPASPGGP